MKTIMKTFKLGEPKYFAGIVEVPMGFAVILSPNIFGAMPMESPAEAMELAAAHPEYEFEMSQAEFSHSFDLSQQPPFGH